MTYRLEFTAQALHDLRGIPASRRAGISAHLDAPAGDPRPPGVVAVKGYPPGNYRLRVGTYRVGYEVDDHAHLITVWQIGDRKRFYERAQRRR